jgi:hypothetical protein
VVGLAYAQEKFGIIIPQAVIDGIDKWIGYIQCPNDGGSGYNAPCDPNAGKGGENILKTSNLLYEMSVVGDTSATSREQNAIHFIESHWNDPTGALSPGWILNGVPHYQAAFCIMKGFDGMGIDKISVLGNNVDWFDEVSTAIINNQVDGHWPSDYWGDQILSTEWALLTLERTIVRPSPSLNSKYETMKSFEQLLRDQHNLLVSFDDLMGQTPATREQKIEFLYSIEDLYRRQAVGMDKFSVWIDTNWQDLTADEKAQITSSLEDLLRRQANNLEAYNGNLLAWVKTFDPIYRQKFSDSFEDLLHRQVALLKNFERVLTQDGMQTPSFLASCEDLLRRQAQSLEGFGDLGQFTFNTTQAQEGPGIAIYKTADKTTLACGDNVTYKYMIYNNGDEEVTDIQVTDSDQGPVGEPFSLGVYQSKSIEETVTTECSPDEIYPIKVCNTATAAGTASSGEIVKASSDDVCIILNGPSSEVKCKPIQGIGGKSATVRGRLSSDTVSGCVILILADGTMYSLEENNADAWTEVNSILTTEGCAEVSGCAYEGLQTDCNQGTPLYVNSCTRIDCPPDSSCPDRSKSDGSGILVGDTTLVGPITKEGECFILTDGSDNKYELSADQNYPNAWHKVGTIEFESEIAQIRGCEYTGVPNQCSDIAIPVVYVKSCAEAEGDRPVQGMTASIPNDSVKPIVPSKNQSNPEVKKENATLEMNQSGLEVHPGTCPTCGKTHTDG